MLLCAIFGALFVSKLIPKLCFLNRVYTRLPVTFISLKITVNHIRTHFQAISLDTDSRAYKCIAVLISLQLDTRQLFMLYLLNVVVSITTARILVFARTRFDNSSSLAADCKCHHKATYVCTHSNSRVAAKSLFWQTLSFFIAANIFTVIYLHINIHIYK